jgi:ABC-type multidrug transport system fused ATPase/permease subunit
VAAQAVENYAQLMDVGAARERLELRTQLPVEEAEEEWRAGGGWGGGAAAADGKRDGKRDGNGKTGGNGKSDGNGKSERAVAGFGELESRLEAGLGPSCLIDGGAGGGTASGIGGGSGGGGDGGAGLGLELELRDVAMRYAPHLPPALCGVSLRVPPGQRLGIVGRTGAGKSSLIVAIMRLCPALSRGSVRVGGVDARALPLRSLRRAVGVISQDALLFVGRCCMASFYY